MALTELDSGRQSVPALRAGTPRGVLTRLWTDRWIYLFLLPTAILYSMYALWPIGVSWWYSLLDWNGFGDSGTYIGLDNYREVFQDGFFWRAVGRTFLFAVITVPIRLVLALVVAIMLNNPRLPFARLFRTALFLPVVTTTAIIGVVMQFVFDPAGGPVNIFLLNTGLVERPVNFLGDSSSALYTVMGVHIWKWFGVTMIYWLAALQTINDELYQAARVDGASSWNIFTHITLPLLKPFTLIIGVLTFIDTMEVFDLILTMTSGGPFFSTEVIDVFIYRQAFAATIPRLGYASAAAVAFGLLTIALAVIQFLTVRNARRARSTS
ncbi:MAG: sugar ABC transporter permease [Chloroflexota bacterium]|nr:sugar ABC transporter permease [Chloroflexota bacterium]